MTAAVSEILDAALKKKMVFGEDDCWFFAAKLCRAQTGVDFVSKLKTVWRSQEGAAAFVLKYGRSTKDAAVALAKEWNIPEIDPSLAQPGDLAMVPNDMNVEVMACRIERGFAARAAHGFAVFPAATRAWRIEHAS